MLDTLTTVGEIAFGLVMSAGVAMIYLPAGLIVLGILGLAFCYLASAT